MKGPVAYVHRDMVAVEVDAGCYSILELLGDEVEVGDVLEWDGYALGREWCVNLTQRKRFEPFFQNHDVPAAQLRQPPIVRARRGIRQAPEQ